MTAMKLAGRMLAACLALSAGSAFAAPPERTLTVDVIDLVEGREVPGKAEIALEHEGIEYRFATPAHKAAFEKEPAKYGVADGGACGRMGPLSGLGDARRYAVHGGRVFFFASDGCREGFLKDPAAHIEGDEEMPFGSHEQVLQGRATLDKLVAWAGGADTVRAIRTYRATAARTEKQGDKDWAVTNETAIDFPDKYFQKEAWNEHWFSTASGPDGCAMASGRGVERIAESRGRAFNRTMARRPLVVMKAHVDGAPRADCPGLVVIGDGEGMLDDAPVEYVKVWLNGAASRFTIEKSGGKLRQVSFHGRDGSMRLGDCVRTFTAWATVNGITLPTAYTVTLDGKDNPRAAAKIDAFEINGPVPAGAFDVPEAGG